MRDVAKCRTDYAELWERYGWILREVAKRHRVDVEKLCERGRDPRVTVARRDAYVCLYGSGLTYSEIGRMLGRDHTSILAGVRRELAGIRVAS